MDAELATLKVTCEKVVEESPAVQLAKITAKQKEATEANRMLEAKKKTREQHDAQNKRLREEENAQRETAEKIDHELEILQARYSATRKRMPTAQDEEEIDERTKELYGELKEAYAKGNSEEEGFAICRAAVAKGKCGEVWPSPHV